MTAEGWAVARLSRLGDWCGSGTPSKERAEFWSGHIPWVSPKDMQGTEVRDTQDHISEDAVKSSATSLVPPGTILMVTRSGILRHTLPIATTKVAVAINQDLKALQVSGKVDAAYIAQLLRHRARDILRQCAKVGTTVESIDFNALREFPVLIATLPEQRKIAAILSSVDDAIEASQAVIDQLQVVKKAMMAELLTKGIPGRHKKFKQTEIGELPEEWEVCTVGDLLESSAYGTSVKCDTSSGGLPVLRIPNVVSERVTFEDLKFAQSDDKQAKAAELREGDLLVIRTNGNPMYVGRSAVVPGLNGEWSYASYLIHLRPRLDKISPWFLHLAMRSDAARKSMQGAIRTSAGNYNLNTQGIGEPLFHSPRRTSSRKLCVPSKPSNLDWMPRPLS